MNNELKRDEVFEAWYHKNINIDETFDHANGEYSNPELRTAALVWNAALASQTQKDHFVEISEMVKVADIKKLINDGDDFFLSEFEKTIWFDRFIDERKEYSPALENYVDDELGDLFSAYFDGANLILDLLQSQAQKEPAKQESKWIPIETVPKNTKILVRYKNALGKDRNVFAKYIEKFTKQAYFDDECVTEYNELDDTYYYAEGWVELVDNWNDVTFVYFDSYNVPTHWMPLPPAPDSDVK